MLMCTTTPGAEGLRNASKNLSTILVVSLRCPYLAPMEQGSSSKICTVGLCLEIVWVPVHDVDSTVLKNKYGMKNCSCTFPVPHNWVNFTFVHLLTCAEPRAHR